MRTGLFFKYDREVVNGSENREIPDLWGRVDRYVGNTRNLPLKVGTWSFEGIIILLICFLNCQKALFTKK